MHREHAFTRDTFTRQLIVHGGIREWSRQHVYNPGFLFYSIIMLLFCFHANWVKNDINNHTIIFNGQTLQAARKTARGVET